MALFVYDHGYRIQTPKESLFPAKGVPSLHKTRHSHRSADKEDNLHADGDKVVLPRFKNQSLSGAQGAATKAYTSTADDTQRRKSDNLTVSRIMVSPVHTVSPATPINSAWQRMQSLEISHLVVIDADKRPLGLLSESDLLAPGTDSTTAIKDIYSRKLIAATPETLVQDVAISFIDHGINAMPVVGSRDEVVGIVCRTDLLRLLVSGLHLERWV
ncbi:CBS domain-containing protein [uncultured Neptuniibacter sp.]|uniref:CBS domain-containing protein n=1 Tax=uncultured Neptuniibacter sp. TaxID=502143 RepID=UPI0026264487|nr:CBS domain-containing protein [uncultured Neptuniibacter sp.]